MSDNIKQDISENVHITQIIIDCDRYAKQTGFRTEEVESIKTAVSELAYNILKYADKGQISIRRVQLDHQRGIEIIATDHGPGIENLEAAMQDHFSSGKTLGLGLPGVKRLMDRFEIESKPGSGTKVQVYKWLR